jgi:membrane protease subunit (stomatin/prohibitin family)
LGKSEVAALDLAANYQVLSAQLRDMAASRVDDEYGLDIPQLFIVNISLPEEVEKALDTRSSMSVIGDMGRFQQYQMGQAMTAAAANPAGGGASEGMGLGMGFAMANQMIQGAGQAGVSPPPPIPGVTTWHLAVNGQTQGPFTAEQISQAVAGGQITQATLVWSAGMAGWIPAGQVPQLATCLGATPPPPPPAGG